MRFHLKYAIRSLLKTPGFTAIAVIMLALGIGVCTAMFSVLNVVLLKPLPFREPGRLVWIENIFGGGLSGRTTRVDVFNGWRDQSKTLASLGAYFAFSDYGRLILTGSGAPESLRAFSVSDNFLPTLGVTPLLGRNFTAAECAFDAPGAIVLGYGYWQQRFAGDPAIVGRKLVINGKPATVVGVLPATFSFDAIFTPGATVDALTPFPLTAETVRWGNTVFGIGRLRPGVTLAQAQAELTVISERLKVALPNVGNFGAIVSDLDGALRGKFRSGFLLLAGAVACVLAITCVNLSNLLLARSNARRQEFAVRVALGASRRHLVGQALTESLLLALAGALAGLPLAALATATLARLPTFGIPLLQSVAVDPAALAVTVALTALAGVVSGLLPALHASRGARQGVALEATHQRSAGRSGSRARNVLVVAEVTLACLLLVGAGLLIRSFAAVLRVDLGFSPQHAMVWRIDPNRHFNSGAEVATYVGTLMSRIAALPGIEAVGASDTLPLGRNRTWGAGAAGVDYAPGTYPFAYPRMIDAGYLAAMKIPLVAGRSFDALFDPQAEKAVIINESLARQLWPHADPLGRKLQVNGGSTVIGVVANVRHSSLEAAGGNEMYLDCRQCGDWSALEMVVRSSLAPEALGREVRAALAAYDPGLPTGESYELQRLVDDAVAPRRLITQLLGAFSALALALAALGLYGVVAYSVTQRTQEIGIRMAVGAQRGDVLRLILRHGFGLVALGVAFGLAGAFALARVLQSLLFGVTAHDPDVFAGNAALLLAVSAVACFVPALRATRVDPVIALRAD